MTSKRPRVGAAAAARDWAVRHFGDGCAVLLYGSYAAGTDGPNSDLDCLVALQDDPWCDLQAAKDDYVRLQGRFGFTPDLVHPVELFTLGRCLRLLREPALRTRLEAACRGGLRLAGDDDAREVFHAFTSPRLALQGLAVVGLIEAEALQLLGSVAVAVGCDGQRVCGLHEHYVAGERQVSDRSLAVRVNPLEDGRVEHPITLVERAVRRAITAAYGDEYRDADPLVRPTQDPRFGDLQINVAMSLAKRLGRQPREVAAEISARLDLGAIVDPPTIAGPGFINLRLRDAYLADAVARMLADERLGVPAVAALRVVIDYSSPNVAKAMHVGHLRSSVIGDALAAVLEFQGHKVVRQNHLGDWGTQFGLLIEHLVELGATAPEDLNEAYRQAVQRFGEDPAFAARARERVVALQSGDEETLGMWRDLVDRSRRDFVELYARLDVRLRDEDFKGESSYNGELAGIVQELDDHGLLTLSEGAQVVFLDEFVGRDGKPFPLIAQKSDGGYLYATTDLAALQYRIEVLGAQLILYVTDNRQAQHFQMIFRTAERLGWLDRGDVRLEHVSFGTVLGEDGRPLRTREGAPVRLLDLIEEAEQRAAKRVRGRDPTVSDEEIEELAHAMGIGAVKYADLCVQRTKDYVFDIERMTALEGNTAPYLQYAHARVRSILRRAESEGIKLNSPPWPYLTQPQERAVALKALLLAPTLSDVASTFEPHRLCTYLYEFANLFTAFYESSPVLRADSADQQQARLALCHLAGRVLRTGLDLLGIKAPERL